MEASVAPQFPAGMSGMGGWWESQTPNNRLAYGLLGAVALSLMIYLGMRLNQPEYRTMYSGLTQEDAASIAQVLDQRAIPYRLNESGSAILVPSRQRDAARIAVAGEGVLPSGPRGYEILDNPNPFSLSDFSQRINLQRAREGELARTLMSLEVVKDARVMLTLPNDSPFLSDREEPGASVALTLRGGARSLSSGEASTIANLVAASVPGLDPRNVVMVDQHATMLAGPHAQPLLMHDSEGRSVVAQFEERVAEKVLLMLEATHGKGNVRVSVSADLDLDRVSSTKETFVPDETTGKGIPRSEEIVEESSQNAPASDEGLAGTVSNIPSYPTPDSTGGNSRTRKSSSTINYEVSRIQELLDKAPGTVKRLSVSVLIDQPDELDASRATQISNLVKAAVGYDETRGDAIEVLALPFNTEAEEAMQAEFAAAKQQQTIDTALQAGGWILALVLFAWGTMQIVKVLQPGAGMSGTRVRGNAVLAGSGPGGASIDIERPQLSPEEAAKQKIRDEILEIAKSHPEEAARVIRAWLRE